MPTKVSLFDFEIENFGRIVEANLRRSQHKGMWMTRIALLRMVCKIKKWTLSSAETEHCAQRDVKKVSARTTVEIISDKRAPLVVSDRLNHVKVGNLWWQELADERRVILNKVTRHRSSSRCPHVTLANIIAALCTPNERCNGKEPVQNTAVWRPLSWSSMTLLRQLPRATFALEKGMKTWRFFSDMFASFALNKGDNTKHPRQLVEQVCCKMEAVLVRAEQHVELQRSADLIEGVLCSLQEVAHRVGVDISR